MLRCGDRDGPRMHRHLTNVGRRPGSLWARGQVSDAGLGPGGCSGGQAGGRLACVKGSDTFTFPQGPWLLLAPAPPPQPTQVLVFLFLPA